MKTVLVHAQQALLDRSDLTVSAALFIVLADLRAFYQNHVVGSPIQRSSHSDMVLCAVRAGLAAQFADSAVCWRLYGQHVDRTVITLCGWGWVEQQAAQILEPSVHIRAQLLRTGATGELAAFKPYMLYEQFNPILFWRQLKDWQLDAAAHKISTELASVYA